MKFAIICRCRRAGGKLKAESAKRGELKRLTPYNSPYNYDPNLLSEWT
jgi:hypothetical protein